MFAVGIASLFGNILQYCMQSNCLLGKQLSASDLAEMPHQVSARQTSHLQVLFLFLEKPFLLPGHFSQQPSSLPASIPALLLLLLLLRLLLLLQLPHPLDLPLHVQHSFLGLLQR